MFFPTIELLHPSNAEFLIQNTVNHKIRAPPRAQKNFGGGSYFVEKNIRKSIF